jgi:large subunit ribosomal protein L21
MYAVIKTGGKQYKVTVGDKLKVEKLIAEEGASVALDRVLMVADGENIAVGSPLVETAVSATVLSHGRGDKIRVFKMKRRKNYRRTQGHRQSFTEIQITSIGDKKGEKKATRKDDSVKKAGAVKKERTAETVDTGAGSTGDVLTSINGIGPVIAEKLQGLGITTFRQIAEFDQAKIDEVNEQLSFKGRIEREEWVTQAKMLIS